MIQKIKIKELNDLFSSFKYKGDIYKIIGFLNDVNLIEKYVNRIITCKNKQTGKYKIIDVSKKGDDIAYVKRDIIRNGEKCSDFFVDLTDIRLTHINPNKVGHLKGRQIRLSQSLEKEMLNFIFCEYELNIGTYHPFLMSKRVYLTDFYDKNGNTNTYTCFIAKDSHGNSYPFEIKDYLYAGQEVIFKFDII